MKKKTLYYYSGVRDDADCFAESITTYTSKPEAFHNDINKNLIIL